MKVTIRKMKIVNFKGVRELEVDFGNSTVISGRNATGKTTVMDAFTWCLFGKDSKGRTAFNVKTIDSDGNVIIMLEHFVEVELLVTGNEERLVTMKRLLEEEWSKPRGKAGLELKCNTTHYFVNGCEIKASDYTAAVGGIISEDLFRMIASPKHFASLEWKVQREILVSMSGNVSYENVADNEELMSIVRQLSGQDLASYKAGVAYRKKQIKAELDSCPVKISAIRGVTPDKKDYASIEKSKDAAVGEISYIDNKLVDINAAERLVLDKTYELTKKANSYRVDQIDVINREEIKEKQRVNSLNAEYQETSTKLETVKKQLESENRSYESLAKSYDEGISHEKCILSRFTEEIDKLRSEWNEVNSREYVDDSKEIVCPLTNLICKDKALEEMKNEARLNAVKAFYENKDSELDRITKRGQAKNEEISKCKEEIIRLETIKKEESDSHAVRVAEFERDIEAYSNLLNSSKLEQPKNIVPQEIKEWCELQSKIDLLEKEISETNKSDFDTTSLDERKKSLYNEIAGYDSILAEKQVIERNEKEIERLEERGRELSQQLADIERLEYNADILEKKRMNEVERRVNGMFSFVRFRMFDKLINGGETPTCVPMVDGVPYSDLNDAMKINAGIDIINTLCRHNNVSAPIFIDNAESVNEFVPTESQTILLKVSEDKCLTISKQV